MRYRVGRCEPFDDFAGNDTLFGVKEAMRSQHVAVFKRLNSSLTSSARQEGTR